MDDGRARSVATRAVCASADTGVYDRWRGMRNPWRAKGGSKRFLLPVNLADCGGLARP
eukprot:gene153-20721_t